MTFLDVVTFTLSDITAFKFPVRHLRNLGLELKRNVYKKFLARSHDKAMLGFR